MLRPALLLAVSTAMVFLAAEPQRRDTADLLDKSVGGFELRDETFVDGIAKLNAQTDLSIAIEFPLKNRVSDPNIKNPQLTERIPAGTVRESLERLCAADGRFAWSRYKNTINIYPKDARTSGSYLMDRQLPRRTLVETSDPAQAVFKTVASLPGPLEQIAFSQTGGATGFTRSWALFLDGLTVRQAFDEIAEHLGAGYGWTLGGATEFRVIRFHAKLIPEGPSTSSH